MIGLVYLCQSQSKIHFNGSTMNTPMKHASRIESLQNLILLGSFNNYPGSTFHHTPVFF